MVVVPIAVPVATVLTAAVHAVAAHRVAVAALTVAARRAAWVAVHTAAVAAVVAVAHRAEADVVVDRFTATTHAFITFC